jgi:AraC family transcriptional regulator, transcriptional activator of pobA
MRPKSHAYSDNVVTLNTVPKVRLYVEHPEDEDRWSVHVGHVTDRGRWRTAPHAHPRYAQAIFVRHGRGLMNLEGSSVPFEGPCMLLLPADCVHGLDYEIDVDRWVVTIETAFLAEVNSKLPEFRRLWAEPRMISLSAVPEAAMECRGLIENLDEEIGQRPIGHLVKTEALLSLLLLTLARSGCLDRTDSADAKPTGICLTERFRELIDQHYTEHLSLQEYASMLAVSLVQLRAACVAVTGHNPVKMIHARIITEAKRNLIFGNLSVEQIAFSLGFSHPSYFTRFFGKEVGQTPGHFRTSTRNGAQRFG